MRNMREWVAWKLVRLAHRLHNPEDHECITITDEHGQVGIFEIVGNNYGCGVSSYTGPDECDGVFEFGCCDVTWEQS